MTEAVKPRSIITPDSFSVAPELLGQPLAKPMRRALAILIDVTLISILVQMGWGAFFGLILAFFVLRRSATQTLEPTRGRRLLRFRLGAAVILFIVGLSAWNTVAGRFGGDADQPAEKAQDDDGNTTFGDVNIDLSMSQVAEIAKVSFALSGQDDPAQARRDADSLVSILKSATDSPDDLEDLRQEAHKLFHTNGNVMLGAAIDSAFGPLESASSSSRDSLAAAYANALQGGQPAQADSLANSLAQAVAGDQLRALRQELNDEERKNEKLEQQVETLNKRSPLRAAIGGVIDDLGLGFGWMAVYFTSFLVLMRGQTPGKRMLRMRVVRLDAKPLTWWLCFERFGGYAASASVGLLGFMQILWDRNRQGLHDKVVETVVIRIGNSPSIDRPH
jgi:uncharacterized RDD family membrane protein YckC